MSLHGGICLTVDCVPDGIKIAPYLHTFVSIFQACYLLAILMIAKSTQ